MKCWVFDMDGTLIDSHATYYKNLTDVLEDYGAKLTEADKAQILKISVKERINFFTEKLIDPEKAKSALIDLEAKLAMDYLGATPFAGMTELVQSLHAKKLKLAVWTAREKPSAMAVLKHTGLDQYFSFCMSGTCVSACKPAPEGLHKISEHFQIPTADIVMVGDHDNDVMAAKACGAKAVRAYWHNPNLELKCQLSDWKFNKVSDFKNWLSALPLN